MYLEKNLELGMMLSFYLNQLGVFYNNITFPYLHRVLVLVIFGMF